MKTLGTRRPFYSLRHVTPPLIAPYLIAAFGLSVALSLGELGAMVMVYLPAWVTLPVATLALLVGLERAPFRPVAARS
ncbi:hypothetical protein [Methylocapsa sp. S129]|uniref:hypothetical protein n=1 Tax=Methylocapsa sp. S129 TaxID=1641869 RepID=UPI001FED5651|nr:hypothetical protein [Methylocapsa sp. S129]